MLGQVLVVMDIFGGEGGLGCGVVLIWGIGIGVR